MCVEKPSDNVVILVDPTSNTLFGKQSVENCKLWTPTPATRAVWTSLMKKRIPNAELVKQDQGDNQVDKDHRELNAGDDNLPT